MQPLKISSKILIKALDVRDLNELRPAGRKMLAFFGTSLLYLCRKTSIMRALIQKVSQARVQVESETVSQIESGILVFLGIESDDTKEDIDWLARKIAHIRLFRPPEAKKEESVIDIGGEILVVSQFTLHASTKKGNRPSYIRAARPEQAEPLYEKMIAALNSYLPGSVFGGRFGAMMQVELINDGPMTIWIDSKNKE